MVELQRFGPWVFPPTAIGPSTLEGQPPFPPRKMAAHVIRNYGFKHLVKIDETLPDREVRKHRTHRRGVEDDMVFPVRW